MTEVWIGKRYTMVDSENFNEYMEALGVNIYHRCVVLTKRPTVEMRRDGDIYNLVTSTSTRSSEVPFKLNEPFERENLNGRIINNLITLEGNTFVHNEFGDPPSRVIREFTETEMVSTMTCRNITCTIKYAVQD